MLLAVGCSKWAVALVTLLVTPNCKFSGDQHKTEICAFKLKGVCDGDLLKREKHVYWHVGKGFFHISLCRRIGIFMWVALLLFCLFYSF